MVKDLKTFPMWKISWALPDFVLPARRRRKQLLLLSQKTMQTLQRACLAWNDKSMSENVCPFRGCHWTQLCLPSFVGGVAQFSASRGKLKCSNVSNDSVLWNPRIINASNTTGSWSLRRTDDGYCVEKQELRLLKMLFYVGLVCLAADDVMFKETKAFLVNLIDYVDRNTHKAWMEDYFK